MCTGEAASKAAGRGKKEAAGLGTQPAVRLPVAHVLSRELQAYHDHACSVLGFHSRNPNATAAAAAAGTACPGMPWFQQ